MATGLENLKIYKLAVRLEIFVHKVVKNFPSEEKYSSCDNLKRSSSSVANNIAEAYGKFSYGAKINHIYIARGEAEETKSGLQRAYLKRFISKKIADFTNIKYTELLKQINSYIKFLRNKKTKNRLTT